MAIQMFAPVYDVEACLKGIKDCLEKGWTGRGYKTIEFEEAWKEYTGLPNAHFLTTGTAGLNLAVETMKEEYGWSDGDEIISTPLTFVATNNSILFAKMKPVFADVDETLCLDPKDVVKKITEKTRAVIFVGIGGNAGHYNEIVEICRKYDLKLILDAAHMAGTRLSGEMVGKEADAVVYSYHVTKNLSTAESGMLCFKEKALDTIVRNKSFNGISKLYDSKENELPNKGGYDVRYLSDAYNGNSIMAAIALAQLPHLNEENAYRRQIAAWYDEGFEEYGDIIKLVSIPKECESARWLYQIIVEDRDRLMIHLMSNDIGCGIHYPDNTLYKMYASEHGKCDLAAYYSDHLLTLPLHLKLNMADVRRIIDCIVDFLTKQIREEKVC